MWNAGLGQAVSVLRHKNSLVLSRSELQVVLHGVDVALGLFNLRVRFYPVTVLKSQFPFSINLKIKIMVQYLSIFVLEGVLGDGRVALDDPHQLLSVFKLLPGSVPGRTGLSGQPDHLVSSSQRVVGVAGVQAEISLQGVLNNEEMSAAGVGDLVLIRLERNGDSVLEPADLQNSQFNYSVKKKPGLITVL